jgi:hypothetical protein
MKYSYVTLLRMNAKDSVENGVCVLVQDVPVRYNLS